MNWQFLKQTGLVIGTALISSTASAHPSPQHQMSFLDGLWHMLTEPDHLLILLAVLLGAGYLLYRRSADKKSQSTKDK